MKLPALLVALTLLCVDAVRAEPPKTPDDVMAFALQKMEQYKTWDANFSHLISDSGTPFASEGKVLCKLPHQLQARVSSELLGSTMKVLMVVGDDRILWLQASGAGGSTVMHGDLRKLSSSDIKSSVPQAIFLELMEPRALWEKTKKVYDFKCGTNEVLEGKSMYEIEGTLRPEAALELMKSAETNDVISVTGLCRFLIGADDGFIHLLERSVRYVSKDPKKTPPSEGEGIVFKKLSFNQDLPDEKFIFEPIQGAPIVELPLKDALGANDVTPPPARK